MKPFRVDYECCGVQHCVHGADGIYTCRKCGKEHVVGDGRKSRGLGDTVAKFTAALGIKPCGGCKQRQEWLNQLVPYKTTDG